MNVEKRTTAKRRKKKVNHSPDKELLTIEEVAMDRKRQWLPEHGLWGAVLLMALKDYLEGQAAARRWFYKRGPEDTAPGGFSWVCDILNLDKKLILKTVRGFEGDKDDVLKKWRAFRYQVDRNTDTHSERAGTGIYSGLSSDFIHCWVQSRRKCL